jgi:hypothetical protein
MGYPVSENLGVKEASLVYRRYIRVASPRTKKKKKKRRKKKEEAPKSIAGVSELGCIFAPLHTSIDDDERTLSIFPYYHLPILAAWCFEHFILQYSALAWRLFRRGMGIGHIFFRYFVSSDPALPFFTLGSDASPYSAYSCFNKHESLGWSEHYA